MITQNEQAATGVGSVAFVMGSQTLCLISSFVVVVVVEQDVLVERCSAPVLNQSAEPFCTLLFKKTKQSADCHKVLEHVPVDLYG